MKAGFGLALTAALALAAPALADHHKSDEMKPANATATYVGTDGNSIGDATLTETVNGVLIKAEIESLPAEDWVAFHIHEKGACDPDTGFKSAGGHFAPHGNKHGFLVEGGPHAGDMPNQYVGADGVLRTQVLNTAISIADVKGRSLMIHAGTDDYESQPSGAAGNRIACAVIE